MRPDAGRAAERVDLEATVIGESRKIAALEIEARLRECVVAERLAAFLRYLVIPASASDTGSRSISI